MIATELKALATALEAEYPEDPINAGLDPKQLNTPCVWVTLDAVTDWTLAGKGEVRARLVLIVGDNDQLRAIEQLDALLERVAAVVTPMSDVLPTTYTKPGSSTPLPALTFTHDI